MASNEFIHVRVDRELKTDVECVLDELGLTTSQTVRLLFQQIKLWRKLPFSIDLPVENLAKVKETFQSAQQSILTEEELRKVTPFVLQILRAKAKNVP